MSNYILIIKAQLIILNMQPFMLLYLAYVTRRYHWRLGAINCSAINIDRYAHIIWI